MSDITTRVLTCDRRGCGRTLQVAPGKTLPDGWRDFGFRKSDPHTPVSVEFELHDSQNSPDLFVAIMCPRHEVVSVLRDIEKGR